MRPQTSYVILATQRTGSSLLCGTLRNTGLAGRPMEYFWRDNELRWRRRWGASTYADYLTKVLEHTTTPNGVFGAKIIWLYLGDFLNKVRRLPGYADLSTPALMSTIFPNLHYIWITRRDKVRQAVSLWRAHRTGVWAQSTERPKLEAREPVFDLEAIDYYLEKIVRDEAAMQRYFLEHEIIPFNVVYEDFVAGYDATVRGILRHLKVSVPNDLSFPEPGLRRQADALSEKWVRRYRQLKAESC